MKIPNSLNLAEEMADTLGQDGYWVLLQRRASGVHCACWNEKYQEGEPTCLKCGGTGWLVRLERHRTRKANATIAISEPNLTGESPLGKTLIQQYRWYFTHQTWPKAGDIIYEVRWDPQRPQQPTGVVNAHYINVVDDQRTDGGAISFFVAATRTVTTNLKVQNIMIRSMGPIQDYLVRGGKRIG